MMDPKGNIHEVTDDTADLFYDPIEEDPRDDEEKKHIKRLYREMVKIRRKSKGF